MAGCVDTDLVIFILFVLQEGVSDMCPEPQNLIHECYEGITNLEIYSWGLAHRVSHTWKDFAKEACWRVA